MKTLLASLIVMLVSFPCMAQDAQGVVEPDPPQSSAPSSGMLTDRVILIVDTSGSMGERGALADAVNQALGVVYSNTDEFDLALITFSHAVVQLNNGDTIWFEMPDGYAATRIEEYLTSCGANGGTNPLPALTLGLE